MQAIAGGSGAGVAGVTMQAATGGSASAFGAGSHHSGGSDHRGRIDHGPGSDHRGRSNRGPGSDRGRGPNHGPISNPGPGPNPGPGAKRAVFVQTDNTADNQVVAYDRASNGSLTQAGVYNTGGLGGVLSGSEVDHLASQGSLAYDP